MADKKYAGISGLSAAFSAIKAAINEKVDKVNGKNVVDTRVENMLCNKTTNGTYVLKATVSSGTVTYHWEPDN